MHLAGTEPSNFFGTQLSHESLSSEKSGSTAESLCGTSDRFTDSGICDHPVSKCNGDAPQHRAPGPARILGVLFLRIPQYPFWLKTDGRSER